MVITCDYSRNTPCIMSPYFTDYPATQKNILNITITSQHARFQHEKKALIASNSRMKSWPISPSMSEDVRSRSSSYNSKFERSSIKGLGANTQHSNTLIVSEAVVILHIYIYILLYIYIYIYTYYIYIYIESSAFIERARGDFDITSPM